MDWKAFLEKFCFSILKNEDWKAVICALFEKNSSRKVEKAVRKRANRSKENEAKKVRVLDSSQEKGDVLVTYN